jgi:heparosan-N-sulfate-glucuronate 5-epimerase
MRPLPSRWLVALASAALLALAFANIAVAHSRTGGYECMAQGLPRDWRTPYQLIHGIPMVDYGTHRDRNPVTSAQYGLASWSLWIRYHDRWRLRAALRVADWLVHTQRTTGKWVYTFPYMGPGSTMPLPVPWGSALAQGQAISLLRRAYQHRQGAVYLRAARRALGPLERTVDARGLLRHHADGIMFDEYPTAAPTLPLNGDLQTLIGLYDLSDLSPTARRLFRHGIATAARVLPEYNAGGGRSLYDLVYESGFPRLLAPDSYHEAHIQELRILDALSPHAAFRRYAALWSGTSPSSAPRATARGSCSASTNARASSPSRR